MSQFQSFFINATGENQCDEINRFLKSHVIIRTVENLVSSGTNCGIQILVEYRDSVTDAKQSKKVDYRSTLKNENQKIIFDRLKDFRAKITKENRLVGAYMVCKDEHLAAIAMNPKITLEEIQNLPHSGNILLKEYARQILEEYQKLLKDLPSEAETDKQTSTEEDEESRIPF